jgi:hypothetical protein
MPGWEYHVESLNIAERWSPKRQAQELQALRERLNSLGSEGWELVSQEQITLVGAILSTNIKGYLSLLFFKRPLP